MEITSRADAKAQGLKRFFTGVPCKHGHTEERFVSDGSCVACKRESSLAWHRANPEKSKVREAARRGTRSEYSKSRYARKRDELIAASRKWRNENPEKVVAKNSAYYKRNRDAIISGKIKRYADRIMVDELFAAKERIRGLIRASLSGRGYKKRTKTESILGCTYAEFKAHIERQFLPNMTWENRHLWHIDHITPLSTAKTEEDVMALNHVSNLRPLWADDNMSKGDKVLFLI